ncbi:MAG: hypothetical protein SWO11_13630 [Thermodesulfobacteriota bacterium]|nr:hypothetical protein [Thermodesulfobacteriota bacterium]
MILRSVIYWTLFLCSFLSFIVLGFQDIQAGDIEEGIHTGQIIRNERRIGPFKLNGREFTLILKLMKCQGASNSFDETAESFSIVDTKGELHYEKSFDIEYGNGGFTESISIWAYALEGSDRKVFHYESGKLKEDLLKGGRIEGLILYYSVVPSAPLSGISCQVFALKEQCLVPLFTPLTVYGQIYELPHGSNPDARILFDEDTMSFGVWTGWFEVVVPVKVFDGLKVEPLHHNLTFGYDAFDVKVRRRASKKETFVRLFDSPKRSSIPRNVIIKKDTKVEFLWAYARASIQSGGTESSISTDEMPWLRVRIDKNEGFVKDAQDLMALGVQPAG